MCRIIGMGDLDTQKHDVDVIERVLGGVRDRQRDDDHPRTYVVDVPSSRDSDRPATVELTVGVADDVPGEKPRRSGR